MRKWKNFYWVWSNKKQTLYHIPEAINGFYIPIVAPGKEALEYYCCKDFYSFILQGVLDAQYKFWNFDFEWPESYNDWPVFQGSNLGIDIMENKC